MSASIPDQLTALSNLIAEAVKTVNSQYASIEKTVPSLDALEPGPFDAPQDVPRELNVAIRTIEAACAQLSVLVASPGHVITNRAYSYIQCGALYIVCNGKIADLLKDKPDGLHVSELSKGSGIDAGKLARVLRLLATEHCFKEVKPDVFTNNRLSVKLSSTDPVSAFVGHLDDEAFKAYAQFAETLGDPKITSSSAVEDSPFFRTWGGTIFDLLKRPEEKARHDRFAQAMVGLGNVIGKGIIVKAYPWDQLPIGSTVVDIGGSNGHIVLDILRAHPHMKAVVQDLPAVVESGKTFWSKEYPEAVKDHRIDFVPIDFMKASPVPGASVYYLRQVIHDWPDNDSITLLQNVKKSMTPQSKLLIHEYVLQHVYRDSPGEVKFEQAPEPLLPNYGVGRIRMYNQDLNMLSIANSKERTLEEFIQLGESVGLKFLKLWDAGEQSLVEFSLA